MIKEGNKQICVVVPKEIDEKLKVDAKKHNGASRNWMARKILVDYYRESNGESEANK